MHVNCSTPDAIQAPSKKVIERLWSDIKRWEVVVNEEAENFTGDILIGRQEEIKDLASLVESWTEVAVQLFTRHHVAENAEKSLENKRMLALNSAIETYHAQCRVRVGGENGEQTYRKCRNIGVQKIWCFIISYTYYVYSWVYGSVVKILKLS